MRWSTIPVVNGLMGLIANDTESTDHGPRESSNIVWAEVLIPVQYREAEGVYVYCSYKRSMAQRMCNSCLFGALPYFSSF